MGYSEQPHLTSAIKAFLRAPPRSDPVIHLYTVCYNEATLLPYFFRHYKSFVDKIVVHDNESTDASPRIALDHGAFLVRFSTGGAYDETVLTTIRNTAYIASLDMADFVIVADVDEFLWHPDVAGVLRRYRDYGVTLPMIAGYDMVSNRPPSGTGQIYDEIRFGCRRRSLDKRIVFNPRLGITYRLGSHACTSRGELAKQSKIDELKLLHYNFLGVEYVRRRWADRSARHSASNIRLACGSHYKPAADHVQACFADLIARAELVIHD
jgi:glycosyltransferase involved in cell wall biosynthesis